MLVDAGSEGKASYEEKAIFCVLFFFVCLFLSFSLGWFGFAGLFVGCTNCKRAKIINAACPVENMLGLGGSWWRVGGRVCVWCVCSLFYLGDVLADLSNCWNLAKADGPDLVVV